MKYLYALLFLFLSAMIKVNAQEVIPYADGPNPGNTGAYAFSFIDHATDAKIGDDIIIDVKLDAGKDNLGNVQGGILRLKVPFAHWVEIEADFVADRWQITDEVKDQYGIKKNKGNFDGELYFKTKIKILEEKEGSNRPNLAFQANVKTAAGDFASTHRYTDTAGYEFAILGSKSFMESDEHIVRKVKVLTELAFIAWDTARSEQNDALKASAGIQIDTEKMNFKVSYLGYYGWQIPKKDNVSTLQLQAVRNINNKFQVYGQVNIGLTPAATPLMVGAGVKLYLPAPKKKRKPTYDL
jgi:hypothetical protein